MTRATVEDSTAGLGQTLRTGRLVVGGLFFHGVSGLCMNPWHTGCQEESRPRGAGVSREAPTLSTAQQQQVTFEGRLVGLSWFVCAWEPLDSFRNTQRA